MDEHRGQGVATRAHGTPRSAVALVVGLALLATGCTMARDEFVRSDSDPVVLTGALPPAPAGTEAPADRSAAPLALSTPGAAAAATLPPEQPEAKLLSPEEKADLIAELEALARNHDARAAADATGCQDLTAQALDPEQQLKRELTDGQC